jgi:hypothetical protein
VLSQEELYVIFRKAMTSEQLISKTLITNLEETIKINSGLESVLGDNWSKVENSPENALKMLRTSLKTNKKLAEMLQQLIVIAIAYSFSGELQVAAAKTALKLSPGDGSEVLQAMFKSKLDGN